MQPSFFKNLGPFDNNKINSVVDCQSINVDDTDKFIKVFEKKIISNYSRSTYFKEYKDELFDLVYSSKNHKLLINLNIDLLKWTMEKLKIKKRLVLSSTLKIKSENKVDRIIKICQKLNSQIYLCNEGAVDYLNESKQHINSNKIEIYNHNYDHPNYGQLFGEFIKYISSIDLLFNEGPNSYDIIKSGSKNLTKIL